MNAIFKLGLNPNLIVRKLLIFMLFIAGLIFSASAQRRNVPISQVDPRFTVSVQRYFSTLGGSEEYYYYVQNNTNQEYKMVITVTIDLACVGTKTYILGVNKIVYLPPNGKFTPDSDWAHILTSGADNFKSCRLKDGDSYTLFKGISYKISNIVNITAEKAAAEKKKQDDLLAKQKQQADEKAKAEKDKLAKDNAAKEALAKKATVAGGSTVAKNATNAGAAKPSATNNTSKTSGTSSSVEKNVEKTQSSTTSNVATDNLVSKQQQAAQIAAQQKADEDASKAAEAEELMKKQQAYDSWKQQKDNEQSIQDAASFAASVGLMAIVGGWIYDDMGKFDPMFALQPKDEKQLKFHMGLDFGYSLSTMPILYASDINTMVNGKEQNTKSIQAKQPFTFNIEAFWKLGMDHQNYGGYAYLNPKLGFSPIFDGFQFSPLNFGGRVYGGAKWAKAYFGYGGGQRQFTHSSHDTEEAGKGNAVINYGKIEFGILFTTKADENYKRNHISIGMINEKFKPYDIGGFGILDPETGTVKYDAKTGNIQGFSFQWRKDHTFNWYINAYPKFVYSGDVKDGGALSSSFSDTKTGTFFEMGFIRALDFY